MDELFRAIAGHLRTLGYTAIIEEGIVKATHPQNAAFWVVPINGGALFRALFVKGRNADADELGYLRFLAQANRMSIVSRFSDVGDMLSVEAWFPNCLDQSMIGNFFARYLLDISAPVQSDLAGVQRYFPPPPAAR